MYNDKVCFTIKESKGWKKETNEIVSLQQAYLEESISLRNEADRLVIWDTVNNLMYTMNTKVQNLGEEDKK